jgi:hypothetical protein
MDEMNVSLGQVGSVDVTTESHLLNWRRPILRRWNDEAQRSIWSDDYGFEFLAEMVDREVWWPVRLNSGNETT